MYIRTLPKGLRIPRTLRETAIESDADVPGGASEACACDQPRVWGINEPYSDPTATLQRPYSDPTATLQRPYRPYNDPTTTLQTTLQRPYTVHQGNASRGEDSAHSARNGIRIVPDGCSHNTYRHLGRFGWRVETLQRPYSDPTDPPEIPPRPYKDPTETLQLTYTF